MDRFYYGIYFKDTKKIKKSYRYCASHLLPLLALGKPCNSRNSNKS